MDDQEPDSTKKTPKGSSSCEYVGDPEAVDFDFATNQQLSSSHSEVIDLDQFERTNDTSLTNKDFDKDECENVAAASAGSTYESISHNVEQEDDADANEECKPPALPKLTIKRTAPKMETQLPSFFCSSSTTINSTSNECGESGSRESDDHGGGAADPLTTVPKLKLKITKDTQVATEYPQIPKLTIKTNYLEQGSSTTVIQEDIPDSLPKLKLKTTYKAEEMTPLEILTPAQKISLDSGDENCQKSPRIILKINKNQSYCVSTSNSIEVEDENRVQEVVSTTTAITPAPPLLNYSPKDSSNDMDIQVSSITDTKNCIEFSLPPAASNLLNIQKNDLNDLIQDSPSEGSFTKIELPLCNANEMSDDVSFSNSMNDNCIIVPDESNSDCMIVEKMGDDFSAEDPLKLQNFKEYFPTFENTLPETSADNSITQSTPTIQETPVKRRRGRPRKNPIQTEPPTTGDSVTTMTPVVDSSTMERSPSPSSTRRVRKRRMKKTPAVVPVPKVQITKTPARQKFNKNKYFKQKMLQEKINNSIQIFEEDTRMSGEIPIPSSAKKQQSSGTKGIQSNSQKTMDSSSFGEDSSSKTITKKSRGRMEVNEEAVTEFTVDMLAEYDWPPPVGCCPNKNRDTYMLQEQIAEHLGVKSFKRKYPDLHRRPVEMEERNYLIEKKLVSESMSNMGLTAVYAVDILDIMYQDFNDKYEEYKKYHREKQLKELNSKQQKGTKNDFDKATVHEKALKSTATWNTKLNRERNENRNGCIDLQNYIIHIPKRGPWPPTPVYSDPETSAYPVQLIPGQYSTHWESYSPLSLIYLPLKTARPINAKYPLENMSIWKKEAPATGSSSESSSDSGSDSSSMASSESFSDSDDENCAMCTKDTAEKRIVSVREDQSRNPCVSCKRKNE